MIIGIGTDICDIRRIQKLIERHGTRFLNRIFSPEEQAYCDVKARPEMAYAKRFAAKEAVAKSIAAKQTGPLPWLSVCVKNDPSGRPTAQLSGAALDRLQSHLGAGQTGRVHLSLSDDYPYASAFAIAEVCTNVREAG